MNGIECCLINLPIRSDRLRESLAQLAAISVTNPSITEAVYTPSNGAIGCAKSHACALSNFLSRSAAEYCLIFEDDIQIRNPSTFWNDVAHTLRSIENLDVVLLSSNAAFPIGSESVPGVYRVVNAQTTSAYLVSRSFAPTLVKKFFESANQIEKLIHKLSNKQVNHFYAPDMIWKELQLFGNFYAYLPPLIFQRESYSDIEQKIVSYGA
jgi:GR25 family glycosyltransferase involved in LPS biosynthesis